jgi:hypothetical protein
MRREVPQALLEELGHAVPKTHNLDDVLNLLLPTYPTLRSLRRGLIPLSNFAVETRYPGEHTTRRQATATLRRMENTRTAARHLLGIRAVRKRRKKSP